MMNLESLRSKLNIHRLFLKKQNYKEKEITCCVETEEGLFYLRDAVLVKDEDKFIIVFKY